MELMKQAMVCLVGENGNLLIGCLQIVSSFGIIKILQLLTIHFGRVEWFAKYNLGWESSTFTLEDFLKSDYDTSYLAQKWIENYIYNTLTLGDLLSRIDYWKKIILGGTSAWKWLYSKKIRLT